MKKQYYFFSVDAINNKTGETIKVTDGSFRLRKLHE